MGEGLIILPGKVYTPYATKLFAVITNINVKNLVKKKKNRNNCEIMIKPLNLYLIKVDHSERWNIIDNIYNR